MKIFSSLAATQTDLDKFSTVFEESFRIFQENFQVNSKNFQIWVCNFIFNLHVHKFLHVHAKFKLSSLYPDGLKQIFDLFSRKTQDFLLEN
jgi:hypothetical protein